MSPKMEIAPIERFWSRVAVGPDCWEWTAAKIGLGYGAFAIAGRTEIASRISYEMAFGPIPAGMSVLHICDNPPCVRPSHLFLGTLQDNIADAVAKGRMNYGDRNAWATMPERMRVRRNHFWLTEERVAEIRVRSRSGETMGSIAKSLGVTTSAVSRIVNGKRRAAA